ncbi:MAG: multidrug effflux MFS transporter [Janthinobacterium lividum]
MRSTFFLVLLLAVCLAQMAADIYAPSLPAIALSFDTTISHVQWSMSIYMLGVAVSQLIYGPLSEGVGRKPPIVSGLIIMVIGSVICMTSSTIDTLIVGRLIQGLGAGACTCLWRSIFRDVFTGEDLARSSSYLNIFIIFIIPSAPLLGGYLQVLFNWRANFVFMTGYTLVALAGMIFIFKETNQTYHVSKLKTDYIVKNYALLLKNRFFMGLSLSTFLTYGAFFSWFVIGPVLLIEKIGISPSTFGWLSFCGGAVACALAGYINGQLVKYLGMTFMMRVGWSIMILSGMLMAL